MSLTKWKIGPCENGYGEKGLILLDGRLDRIVSLVKSEDGQIIFSEESDGYFNVVMSRDDAKQALREAIAWIDEA